MLRGASVRSTCSRIVCADSPDAIEMHNSRAEFRNEQMIPAERTRTSAQVIQKATETGESAQARQNNQAQPKRSLSQVLAKPSTGLMGSSIGPPASSQPLSLICEKADLDRRPRKLLGIGVLKPQDAVQILAAYDVRLVIRQSPRINC